LRRGHLRLISNSPKATAGRRQTNPSSFGVARQSSEERSDASQIFQGAGRAQLNEMRVVRQVDGTESSREHIFRIVCGLRPATSTSYGRTGRL
jgi:hypothetical protein